MYFTVDVGDMLRELPAREQQRGLDALHSGDIETVYHFLRGQVPIPARMILDMGWSQLKPDDKHSLSVRLRQMLIQDAEDHAAVSAEYSG